MEYIERQYTENTGGGVLVDVLVLKSGKVITLTDDSVAIWSSEAAWQESAGPEKWMPIEGGEHAEVEV